MQKRMLGPNLAAMHTMLIQYCHATQQCASVAGRGAQVEAIEDTVLQQLRRIAEGGEVEKKDAELLKKRKLVVPESWKTYRISKGPKFALEKKKAPTDLTADMIQTYGHASVYLYIWSQNVPGFGGRHRLGL
jgi:hypothetical protein